VGSYAARRLLHAIPVLLGATLLLYALVYLLPGDPVQAMAGLRPVPEETLTAVRAAYRLDQPLHVQYLHYLGGLLQGDLGRSFDGRTVTSIIMARVPVTLRLMLVAVAFEVVLGVAAGLLAALRRGSFVDTLVLVTTTAVISIPVFVLGFVAQLTLGAGLGLFPISGVRQGWFSYLLPGFVLGAVSLAYVARLLRAALVDNLDADYVRTATAKGLSRRRVVGRHALRNSLIPVVTYVGIDVGALMAGAVVTEGIFNLPGIGGEVFRAIQAQDGPVVVGIVTLFILVFVLVNLVVDLAYGVLDPRLRHV